MEKRITIEDKPSILSEEFADKKAWSPPAVKELEIGKDTMLFQGPNDDGPFTQS